MSSARSASSSTTSTDLPAAIGIPVGADHRTRKNSMQEMLTPVGDLINVRLTPVALHLGKPDQPADQFRRILKTAREDAVVDRGTQERLRNQDAVITTRRIHFVGRILGVNQAQKVSDLVRDRVAHGGGHLLQGWVHRERAIKALRED